MSELPVRPSRVDFEKVDLNQIQRILSTGTLDSLRPEEREYFSLKRWNVVCVPGCVSLTAGW